MHYFQLITIVTFFCHHIFLVVAQPVAQPSTSECEVTAAKKDEKCWQKLGLSDFILNWSPPACGNGGSVGCCGPKEAWTTCFIRIAVGEDLGPCTEISNDVCPVDRTTINLANQNGTASEKSREVAQYRYTLYNIYSKHCLSVTQPIID